jgi:hypothetical protein
MPYDVFIEVFMEREHTGEDAEWTGYLAQYSLLDNVSQPRNIFMVA